MLEIKCPLRDAGYISKHEKGLVCPEGELTFYEYDELVSSCAQRLRRAGVSAGERVGLVLDADWRQPVLLLAVIRAGAVACPVDPSWAAQRIENALKAVSARRVVVGGRRPQSPIEGMEVLDAGAMAELGAAGAGAEFPDKRDSGEVALILFPGGPDEGRPPVAVSYAALYYSALGFNAHFRLRSHDRYLLSRPIHSAEGIGIVFRCLLSGATLVVGAPGQSQGSAVLEHGITHVSCGPEEMEPLLTSQKDRETPLKQVLADRVVPLEDLHRGAEEKIGIYAGYSLPEMGSWVTAVALDSPPEKRETAGRLLRHRELRIQSDGRILVRGQTLFSGYVRNGKIVPCLDGDGWFDTGDNGSLDADGYLTVVRSR